MTVGRWLPVAVAVAAGAAAGTMGAAVLGAAWVVTGTATGVGVNAGVACGGDGVRACGCALGTTGCVFGLGGAGISMTTLAMMVCSVSPPGATVPSSPVLASQITLTWPSKTAAVTRKVLCL